MNKVTCIALACAATIGSATAAQAQLTTYTGGNSNVTTFAQMPNAQAAAASFAAAAPGLSTITFESALPAGVTITGTSYSITNTNPGPLYGINTTPGGASYLYFSGTVTFTFSTAVNAFGFYITGVQTDVVPGQTLTFNDGSTQTILTPTVAGGGGVFLGFTDVGRSVTSVTYNAINDLVAIDDVRYGNVGAVPEPASWALMILGFGLAGAALRVRSRRVTFATA